MKPGWRSGPKQKLILLWKRLRTRNPIRASPSESNWTVSYSMKHWATFGRKHNQRWSNGKKKRGNRWQKRRKMPTQGSRAKTLSRPWDDDDDGNGNNDDDDSWDEAWDAFSGAAVNVYESLQKFAGFWQFSDQTNNVYVFPRKCETWDEVKLEMTFPMEYLHKHQVIRAWMTYFKNTFSDRKQTNVARIFRRRELIKQISPNASIVYRSTFYSSMTTCTTFLLLLLHWEKTQTYFRQLSAPIQTYFEMPEFCLFQLLAQ